MIGKKGKEKVIIPDSAVRSIMNGYLLHRHTEGVPVSLGISHTAVESVLELFFEWATKNGHYKDGVLNLVGVDLD